MEIPQGPYWDQFYSIFLLMRYCGKDDSLGKKKMTEFEV